MNGAHALDQGTLAATAGAYRERGFAVLSPVFDAVEVAGWRAECERLSGMIQNVEKGDRRVQSRGRHAGGTVRDRYDPVTEFSPLFRALTGDPRLRTIAAAALGNEPIHFKDRLILKASGTSGYGLHRDWPYWSFLGIPPDEFVSLMLSVDATGAENGALEVYPGMHRAELPASAEDPRDLDPAGVVGLEPCMAATRAGDVLLLHPTAPHRSGPNLSGGSRRLLTIVFTVSKNADARNRYYASQPFGK
jgi:ectoine hydroxylase-related dioxygenase (phytanoyl-CoA dioxygenase family)